MKKLILFLLMSIASYGQADFPEGIQISGGQPTDASSSFITSTRPDGVQAKVLGENISLSVIPPTTHYVPTSPNLQGHFKGIDNALGNITQTTAGVITRVWWTADAATIGAGTFYLTNPLGKGTAASAIQSVVNGDDTKTYFAQDLIGQPFINPTVFPAGTYAGNLSASTSPNNAQQRYSVELYRCNNAGAPIASGVAGAPVGSLGVTVIVMLDSGLLTLVDGVVTNVPVNGTLGAPFNIAVGERIRYHVAAEKVGIAGGNITQSVYYGTNYNSYIDVPVTFNTSSIVNVSSVVGATATEAFNTLNSGKQDVLTNPITGSLTSGYLPKATGSTSLGNSLVYDDGSFVGLGTTTNNGNKLRVVGGSTELDQLKYTRGIEIGNQDLDTLTDAGFYTGNGGANSVFSDGNYYVTVECFSGSSTFVHQTLTSFGNGSQAANRVLSRIRNSSGWQSWQEIVKYSASGTITTSNGALSTDAVNKSQHDLKADLASPALTGTPTAPTATAGTNTTQIATTAFVQSSATYTASYVPTGTLAAGTITFLRSFYSIKDNMMTLTVNFSVTGLAASFAGSGSINMPPGITVNNVNGRLIGTSVFVSGSNTPNGSIYATEDTSNTLIRIQMGGTGISPVTHFCTITSVFLIN